MATETTGDEAPLRPTPHLKLNVALLLLAFLVLFAVTAFARSAAAEERAALYFSPEQIKDGLRYAIERRLLFWVSVAVELALLTALACTGLGRKLADACSRLVGWRGPLAGAVTFGQRALDLARFLTVVLLVGAFVYLTLELLLLPVRLARLELARAWDMTERGWASWFGDYAKSLAVSLIIGGVLLAGLYLLLRWLPRRWWLAATALSVALGVAFAFLLPVLVSPLFNTFTPLEDDHLRERFEGLAARAGVPVNGVLVMDASRQSRHTNAYFTGFGATRRIVVYDTLLAPLGRLDPAPAAALTASLAGPGHGPFLAAGAAVNERRRAADEVESVLAHEIGHWRQQHIVKGIALAGLGGLVGFWVMARLLRWAVGRAPFALRHVSDPAGIPFVLWLGFLGTWLAMPVENAVGRYFERQADWEALELARSPEAFIDCERRMARENLSNVAPSPLGVWLFATHPPVLDRIRMAEEWSEQQSWGAKLRGGG